MVDAPGLKLLEQIDALEGVALPVVVRHPCRENCWIGISLTTSFQRAFDESSTSLTNRLYWRLPSIVWFGSVIASLHAWETGSASDGASAEKNSAVLGGTVGARSGKPVAGLSQVPPAEALALRNERSSRKNSSRFFPHRNVR